MAAGRRNARVMFQRNVPVENDSGDQIPDWQKRGHAWVAIAHGRGDERRLAASEQRIQSATITALDCAMTRSASIADRVVHHDQAWNIVGIVPRPEKGEIDFDVRRAD